MNREFNHRCKIAALFCLTLGQNLPGSGASGGTKSSTWMTNRLAAANRVKTTDLGVNPREKGIGLW